MQHHLLIYGQNQLLRIAVSLNYQKHLSLPTGHQHLRHHNNHQKHRHRYHR